MTDFSELSSSPSGRPNLVALVADDFSATRANLTSAIQTFDPSGQVIEAKDGNQAVAALAEHVPDIAFVNVSIASA